MDIEFCCPDASAFSLGFAAAHKNTLVLEKSENVLSDCVNAVRPCRVTAPRTDAGRAFIEHLNKCGCISEEGLLDSPSLAPAAARYALDADIRVLLGAQIISHESGNGREHIRIYTNSGLMDIVCRRIIRRPEKKPDRKYLNGIVSGTDRDTLSAIEQTGGKISQSFEKDEFIVSLPFGPGCLLNEARIGFTQKMRECFGTSVFIDAFAADFEYESVFGGITEEFEAGVGFDLL